MSLFDLFKFSSKTSRAGGNCFYSCVNAMLLLFCILSLAACKKESKSVNPVVGTWTLDSTYTELPIIISANAAQFPCLANNIITFNSDNTATASYIGADTCYLLNMPGLKTFQGVPGHAPEKSTWTTNGNKVNLTSNGSTLVGTITQVSGKYHLLFIDTIKGSVTSTLNSGFVKE